MSPGQQVSPHAFAHAVAAYNNGQFVEAERLFGAVLDTDADHFDAANLLAIVQFLRGFHVQALASFDRALAIRPDDVEALCNRGIVLRELKRFDAALASFDQTLALRPYDVDALYQRSVVLQSLKRFEAALASCDRALALQPDFVAAWINRGVSLHELKRYREALASYERALELRPGFAEVLNSRGAVLHALGRCEEALVNYEQAIAADPALAPAHNNRGSVLIDLGRPEQSLESFDRAIGLQPDYPMAHFNRGNALKALGHLEAALASYNRALALKPDYPEVLNNRGNVLMKLDRPDAALASYDRALTLKPDYPEAFNNRGNALMSLAGPEAALASFDKAVALRPDNPEALNNRGRALKNLMRPAAAVESYDQALALRPDYADARLGRAMALLLQGDFERGWRDYEARWDTEPMRPGRREFPQPLWLGGRGAGGDGQDLTGKTILLHGEQGFGDTLQFCRFAKLVKQRAARVVLEVQPGLTGLLATLDPAIAVIATGDPLPPFDCHSPLMSLPLALDTTLVTIPAGPAYLSAPAEQRKLWADRLGPRTRPRIGLVWAGNPRLGQRDAHRIDRQRSLALDQLAPLFAHQDCEFHSLQKGDATAQLHGCGFADRIVAWGDRLADFADTAALVAHLDLVITVDTAVAHLAGAVGKPFWLMNRFNTCWRWLIDRDDSPWYPTARIFRQPAMGDWSPVIANVAAELGRLIAPPRPEPPAVRLDSFDRIIPWR